MNKVYPSAQAALGDLVQDDITIASGGFGLCGIPEQLIEALRQSGKRGVASPARPGLGAAAFAH